MPSVLVAPLRRLREREGNYGGDLRKESGTSSAFRLKPTVAEERDKLKQKLE